MRHEAAEQIARLVVQVFSTQDVNDLRADIQSHTEELLKSRGEEDLLEGEISVEVEKSASTADSADAKFTCKSKSALYACREIILPWLDQKYKIVELAPEYLLETVPEQVPDLPDSVWTQKTTDSGAAGKIEALPPFPSIAELMSAHTALLQSEIPAGDSDRPDFLEKVKEFIRRGTQTGTRLNDTDHRRTAQSLLNYWVTVLYRADATPPPDAILAYYSQPTDLNFESSACPYIGLSPFQEADHDRFFGREQLTTAIVQRLKEKRLVVLVGPSGSGKTSALDAGMLPMLKAGVELPESKDWIYLPAITPGSDPLASLASLFTTEGTQSAEELLRRPEDLLELLNGPGFGGMPVVLIIDQFEELFTVSRDDKKRETFINSLLNLKDSAIKHRVILSMRSDRINHIIRRPALNELFRDAEIRVYPPREVDLHEMIEKPAQNIGLKFQSGVVDQLIREIFQDPVGLPLMQFTLLELWAEREGDTITWAALNRLGSCRQALVGKADSLYQSLPTEENSVARRILLRMVRLSDTWEATTEPVRREDLYLPREDNKLVDLVLKKLLAANLARISNISGSNSPANGSPGGTAGATELSSDHQFELAHESLARYWPVIVGWLKRLRETMVTRQRLELFAANWAILGRSEKGLLDNFQLHEAQNWLASEEATELGYNPDLVALVDQSRKAIRREKLIRTALISSSLGLIVFALIITGLFLYWEHGRLKKSTSTRLAVEARPKISKSLDLALLLSLQAYGRDMENPEVRNSLMRALTHSPRMSAYLHNQQGKIKQIAFSQNGSQLSVLGINGTARLWDTLNHRSIGDPAKPRVQVDTTYNTSPVGNCSLLSNDGRSLVSIDEQGSMSIRNLENSSDVRTIPNTKLTCSENFQFSLSDDKKKLAWVTPVSESANRGAQEITVWDTDKAASIKTVPSSAVKFIAFSPDNQTLATANSDDDIILLRVEDLKPIGKPLRDAFNQIVPRIDFSKDGSRLASVKLKGELAVWDVRNQKELQSLGRYEVEIDRLDTDEITLPSCFALSDTGKELVGGFASGSVVFWNIDNNQSASYPVKDKAPVTGIAISSDENSVITLGGKEGPILWQKYSSKANASPSWQDQVLMFGVGLVNPRQIDLRSGRTALVSSIAFRPDSKQAAGACDDGTVVLWDLEQKLPSNSLNAKGFVDFQISREGIMIARTDSDEVVWFDINAGKEIRKLSIKPDWTQPDGTPPQLRDAVFNKNGTILGARYSDNKVVVWELQTGRQKSVFLDAAGNQLSGGDDKQNSYVVMAIDEEGKNLALAADVGTGDRTIRLWSVDDNRMHALPGVKSRIVRLAFSRDGKKLASGGNGGTITVWDTVGNKELYRLSDVSPSPASILDFTNDDTRLVSLSEDRTLRLWDVQPNVDQRLVSQAPTPMIDFVLSPDRKRASIAGIGNDGSIIFWDLDNWQEQFVLPAEEVMFSLGAGSSPLSLVYPSDGNTLAARHGNGTISLIAVDMDSWIKRACPIANRNLTLAEWRTYKVFEDKAWRVWKSDDTLFKQFGTTCDFSDNRSPGRFAASH